MTDTLIETSPEDAGFDPARIEQIKERARSWADGGRTGSLVLLAARHGKIALHEAFGVQSYDRSTPLARDSVFAASSVSKPVTATAIMMLVEDGLLSLNRLATEYLPELRGKDTERIVMHQLLTHTSGFAELQFPPPETDVPCAEGQYPWIHRQVQMMAAADCYKKPGKQNMYCNENYVLLGEIVRRVSGQDLEAFARERIFEPLGMNSSTFRSAERFGDRNCSRDPSTFPYQIDLSGWQDTPNGAVSLKTSAIDLATFGQCFLNGGTYGGQRLLNAWTVQEMTRNQIPGVGGVNPLGAWVPEGSWGLGWMVQGDARWPWSHGMLQPRGSFYHQGASGCSLWVDPVHHVVGVYMSVIERDMADPDPKWEFDKFQNVVTAAVASSG